jgi:hypothetical protein
VAVFGSSGIGTSGSPTKKLIVGIKHSNVICIYINGTDDKIELPWGLQNVIIREPF